MPGVVDNVFRNDPGIRPAAHASLALAFASFGDAFLYVFLPLNNLAVGIPIVWIGILLSVNRFIRIFSNTLLVGVFAKYGLRMVMIIAVFAAIISTLGYSISNAVATWLAFRVLWGLSFSALRTGALGYALQQEKVGFALGLTRGMQELGPMLSLLLAPLMIRMFEPRVTFLILAVLSLPSLYFAFSLPHTDEKPSGERFFLIGWPTGLNAITLLSAVLIDGIVVIVLGVLFTRFHHNLTPLAATTLAAFYLGYRRVCLVIISPGSGWVADRIGLDRMFNISILVVLAGLIMMLAGWIATGAVVVFTFYSVNASITPGSISRKNNRSLSSVAENATWRDVGAAVGTLLGGFLISSQHLETIMAAAVLALTLLVFVYFDSGKRFAKLLYLWK